MVVVEESIPHGPTWTCVGAFAVVVKVHPEWHHWSLRKQTGAVTGAETLFRFSPQNLNICLVLNARWENVI